jgi:hypothetical protein
MGPMIWTTLHWIDRVLFWVLFGLMLWGLFSKGVHRGTAKVRGDGRIELRPNWNWYCFWGMCAAWAPLSIAGWLRGHHSTPLDLVVPACSCLIAVGFFFEAPETIIISDEGLEQVHWLRGNKRIRWQDIVEIRTTLKGGAITAVGANGSKIVHTPMLADRARLLMEIKKHCGDELPEDFPHEPLPGSPAKM